MLNSSLKNGSGSKLISSAYKSKVQRPGYLNNLYEDLNLDKEEIEQPRLISKSPYKILNAPKLKDDFYTSLLDWSKEDYISVVLDNAAYIWSAKGNEA
jgi:hypothetical protein